MIIQKHKIGLIYLISSTFPMHFIYVNLHEVLDILSEIEYLVSYCWTENKI